jgi:hypothetical protein
MPAGFGAVAAAVLAVTFNPPPPAVDLAAPDKARLAPPPVSDDETLRVMVVGDSQAWVLGRALERWAAGTRGAVAVWSVSERGCGVVRGGEVVRFGRTMASPCDGWARRWGRPLEQFRPDIVVVLTGTWDWVDRKLPAWGDWRRFGDPEFDAHVVAEYGAAVDLLASRGAKVVWLTTPCYRLDRFRRDPRRANVDLLPRVLTRRADRVVVYDLYADLCPDGRFTQHVGTFDNARPDGVHMSDEVAAWIAGRLGAALVAIGHRAADAPRPRGTDARAKSR